MSRNSSGTYTLPSGNPVVSGSIISSTWANDTMNDIATALTDSLSRSGKGGMTAAFRSIDGVVATPGISFSSETGSGLYRAAAGDVRMAILGADVLAVTAAGAAITGALSVSTNLSYSGTLTGGTGVINIGSGQIYKDASGNVGIGTSSPAQKFDVRGRAALYGSSDAYQLKLSYAVGTAGFWLGSPSANALSFYNDAGTEKMRLDSSGNLGLGVTPSGWSGGNAGFQTPYGWIVGNNQVNLFCNAYYNATTKYVQNGYASGIQMSTSGGIVFSLAGNNTSGAGANCVFDAAMTLDANKVLTLQGDQLIKNGKGIALYNAANSGYFSLYNSSGTLIFSNGSTQASLSAGGNLTLAGINANTSSQPGNVYVDANGLLYKSTSSGGLGVGQTWQNVTASRAYSTTYTNSTGKPIFILVCPRSGSTNFTGTLIIDSVTFATWSWGSSSANPISVISAVIPNGSTYSITMTNSSTSGWTWSELR